MEDLVLMILNKVVELWIPALISIAGVKVAIMKSKDIATHKSEITINESKKIAKITAEETSKAEFNKIKSQKWWETKVSKYEELVVAIDQYRQSIKQYILMLNGKVSSNEEKITNTLKRIGECSANFRDLIDISGFYFSKKTCEILIKY
jgi:outer membrane PBP1 activator LpoA protein